MIIYIAFAILLIFIIFELGFVKNRKTALLRLSQFTGKHSLLLLVILISFYTVFSFINFGNIKAPVTFSQITSETKEYIFDFKEEKEILRMMMMIGRNTKTSVIIETSMDGKSWEENGRIEEMDNLSQYRWITEYVEDNTRFIKVTVTADNSQIKEIGFLEKGSTQPLTPSLVSGDKEIFDEQHLVPDTSTFLNGSYFDEIFYVTIGLDIFRGDDPYDDDHPPLASILIALGTQLFGVTPFGWRFTANLFGIAMIPLLYLFAYKIFENKNLALFAAFLLTFDFMHFVQTRVAVIEVFTVFFILLTFYFIYSLYKDSRTEESQLKYRQFIFAGISLGLATSCKWIGLYCILPILPLCFMILTFEYRKRKRKKQKTQILPLYILLRVIMIIGCMFAIPFIIYFLSYLPILLQPGKGIDYFIWIQSTMLNFHETFTDYHPSQSQWYEWIILKTPFLYHNSSLVAGNGEILHSIIVCFGNPLLWWTFIPVLLGIIVCLFIERKNKAHQSTVFLVIVMALLFLPWLFIGRIKFIYYFFMHVPFMILSLSLCTKKLLDIGFISRRTILLFCVLVLITFTLFYPVLSGIYTDGKYVDSMLMTLNRWPLTD